MSGRHHIIVGISGASGAAIGARIVERLVEQPQCAVHLVISGAAARTLREEVGPPLAVLLSVIGKSAV